MTPAELIRRAAHALADGRDEEAAELLVRAFPWATLAEDIERAGRLRLAPMVRYGWLP